jgi:hypothetical protein
MTTEEPGTAALWIIAVVISVLAIGAAFLFVASLKKGTVEL